MASSKSTWLIPTGLIVLSVLPVLGGVTRLIELTSGAEVTVRNARFFAAPIPVVIHILSSTLYFILGAFQFSPAFRARRKDWHRAAGRILIPSGVISALSGMWMAVFYAPVVGDGTSITLIRLAVGACVIAFIVLGFRSILAREIASHRAWMMRAYALAIAAGTQPLTLAPIVVIPGWYGEVGFTLGLAAGWLLNLAIAEWLIRRREIALHPTTQSAF